MVATRIEDIKSGDRGTVEYVDQIEGSEGLWIGVDWDDVNRGKHNGCHAGVQYFMPGQLLENIFKILFAATIVL